MTRFARSVVLATLAVLLLGACTSGSTQVTGGGDETGTTGSSGSTGATAVSGPTGTTAATGATGGGELAGPVSVDLSSLETGGVPVVRAFFSCEGVLGTWRYIFQADFGQGISFDVDATVDMSSGAGRLVFGDTVKIPQVGSIGWEDTVDLEIGGTVDAPTIIGTNATVQLTGDIPIPVDTFRTFPENTELPIVAGSDRC